MGSTLSAAQADLLLENHSTPPEKGLQRHFIHPVKDPNGGCDLSSKQHTDPKKMGSPLSAAQASLRKDLHCLLSKEGLVVKKSDVFDLVTAITDVCLCVPESKTLTIQDWHKIGYAFQDHPKITAKVLCIWDKVKACLEGLKPTNILFNQQTEAEAMLSDFLPQILPPLQPGSFATTPGDDQTYHLPPELPDGSESNKELFNSIVLVPKMQRPAQLQAAVLEDTEHQGQTQVVFPGGGGELAVLKRFDAFQTLNELQKSVPYTTAVQQVALTDRALSQLSSLVTKAYKEIPEADENSLASFANTCQSATESYAESVNGLMRTVQSQIDSAGAGKQLFFENANEDCKAALTPIYSNPTTDIQSMLKVCQNVGSCLLAAAVQTAQGSLNPAVSLHALPIHWKYG